MSLDLSEVVALLVVGLFAGWMNVMAGGGSLLSVPVMLLLGLPAPVANGTNRVAILAQNVVAVRTFRSRGVRGLGLALSLAAAATLGALGGAMLGIRFEGVWFNRFLALVMLGAMAAMFWPSSRKASLAPPLSRRRKVLAHLLMIGAGFWGGLIQVGVGFLLMPILHRVLGLDLVRVNAYKVLIVLIYTSVALTVFAVGVQIRWDMGIALALGNATGGYLGARTTLRGGDRWIRMVFAAALTALIVKLLWGT